jgi:hypothetical protein
MIGISAVLLSTALGMGTSAQANADEVVSQDPAAAAIQAAYGIGATQADTRVARQDDASTYVAAIESYLGDDTFAGAYIDEAHSGQLVIEMTGAASDPGLPIPTPLNGHVTFTSVQNSRALLTATKLQSEDAFTSGGVAFQIGFDDAHNTLDVMAPNAVLPTSVQEVFDASSVTPVVSAYDARNGAPLACTTTSPTTAGSSPVGCEEPLRGGVRIEHDNGDGTSSLCTGGFVTQSNSDSTKYLLTEGHCGSANVGTWTEQFPDGTLHVLGSMHNKRQDSTGDWATVTVGSNWSTSGTVLVLPSTSPGKSTTYNASYPINSIGASSTIQGSYVCESGATNGTHCGKLNSVGVDSSAGVHNTALVIFDQITQSPGDYYGYACQGDSGAPVYSTNIGYGLLHAGFGYQFTQNGYDCYRGFYYVGLTAAANDMNVHLT